MKNVKGNAVDLSALARTPGQKGEAEAISFINETREALVVIFQQFVEFDQGMQDAYQSIQYLTAKVRELENEVKKLKGRDLNNGKEEPEQESKPSYTGEGHSSGGDNSESLNDGEAPAGREIGAERDDRTKH